MAPTDGDSMFEPVDDHQTQASSHRTSRLPPHNHVDYDPDHLPKSVVLDNMVYFDDRTNPSTAEGFTSKGHAIKLTFWAAHPPLPSYFILHCPSLPESSPLQDHPRVLRTDGDLVLFRFLIGPEARSMYPQYNDYIIYEAGVNKLMVLPRHPTRLFSDLTVGLLRCRHQDDDMFILASLSWTSRGKYSLEQFDSRSWTWTTRSMHVESPKDCYFTTPTKVINLDGSLGWVDLWNGILICDLLRGDDILHFIRLPILLAPNKLPPRPVAFTRDVSFSNGSLKFSEVWARPVLVSDSGGTHISEDWGAAIMKWGPGNKWHVDSILKASEIIMEMNLSQLLPNHPPRHEATEKHALSRLQVGHPALSLHDDDAVYIMSKVDHMDHKGWMLAVDMRNKTIKGVAEINTDRSLGFKFMYFQSDISNHFAKRFSSSYIHNAAKRNTDGVARAGKQEAMKTYYNWFCMDANLHCYKVEGQDGEVLTILQA